MAITIRIEKNQTSRLQIMQTLIDKHFYVKSYDFSAHKWTSHNVNINHIINGQNEAAATAAIAKALYDAITGSDKAVNIFVCNVETLTDTAKQAINKLMSLVADNPKVQFYLVIDPKAYIAYRNEIRTSVTPPILPAEKPLREWHKLTNSGKLSMVCGGVTLPTQAEKRFMQTLVKDFIERKVN